MVSATSERCIVRTQLDFFSLEDGGRGPGAKKTWAASGNWKGKRNKPFLALAESNTALPTFLLELRKTHVGLLTYRTVR